MENSNVWFEEWLEQCIDRSEGILRDPYYADSIDELTSVIPKKVITMLTAVITRSLLSGVLLVHRSKHQVGAENN